MTAIALCRSLSGIFAGSRIVSMVRGLGNRRGQDKSRKVRPVGRLGIANNFKRSSNIARIKRNLLPLLPHCIHSDINTLWRA